MVVCRKYGGRNLGPKRFEIINKSATEMIGKLHGKTVVDSTETVSNRTGIRNQQKMNNLYPA